MQTISGTFGMLAYAIGAIFGNYFLIYFGVFLVAVFSIIPMFFIEEPRELKEVEDENSQAKATETNWKDFLMLLFAHSFSWIGVQTMFVYMIGFVEQKLNPVSDDETGQILAISFLILNGIGAIFPAFVLEPITERIGRVKTHLLALLVMSIGYFGIAYLWELQELAGQQLLVFLLQLCQKK
jgi:Na+/melibiose symporter-like transporter